MATLPRASTANGTGPHTHTHTSSEAPKSYYEQQRELLISEIAQSLEHVLQNVNRLNRSLEEVIQVGNEFAPVESLWSHFESVMGQDTKKEGDGEGEGDGQSEGVTEGTEGLEDGDGGEGESEVQGDK